MPQNKPTKLLVPFILLAILVSPMAVLAIEDEADPPPPPEPTIADTLKSQINTKTQELNDINQKIDETQKVLDQSVSKGRTLKQEVNRINANISQVSLGIRASEVTISKLGLEISSLDNEIDDNEIAIQLRKKAIEKLLQNFQKKDNEGILLTLLQNKSLSEKIAEIQNLTDLNSGLLSEVNNIRQIKIKLSDQLDQVTYKKYEVQDENQTLKIRKDIAEDQKYEKSSLLAKTKDEEIRYKSILDDLEKQQQAISDEMEKIENALRLAVDPSTLPIKRPGVLAWPTKKPYITQSYGKTAFAQRAYKSKFHNGIDLRAKPTGTRISSAEDGVVIAVGDNGRIQYGKYVLIKHGNNLATLYAHLSRHAVSEGDTVARGDVIGYSGNTGYSFATHLHFVVYAAESVILKSFPGAGLVPVGTTLNPEDYL